MDLQLTVTAAPQFSTLVVNLISSWPEQQSEITCKVKNTQKSLPPFHGACYRHGGHDRGSIDGRVLRSCLRRWVDGPMYHTTLTRSETIPRVYITLAVGRGNPYWWSKVRVLVGAQVTVPVPEGHPCRVTPANHQMGR